MSFNSVRRLVVRGLITAVFLLPLLWMLSAALLPPGQPLPQSIQPNWFSWTTANFRRVWQLVPVGQWLGNSLAVVLIAVPLTLLTSSWAGFGISQLPQAGQRRWLFISLAVLMVPGIALWSTRFLLFKQLGWLDSIWALIAPAWMGTSPFYVLMFYRAFRRVPAAVFDAARLDGAGVWQSWRLVAMPLARPTAVAVAILSFVLYWGDFTSPLLYVSNDNRMTLPMALQLLQQMAPSDWPLLMAGAVLVTAVPVLLFLVIQPYFAHIGKR